jgi:hypothetical protein
VPWQMSYWGLIDATTGIYVDRIDSLEGRLAAFCGPWMRNGVLASRCQKQAAVRCESQPSKERCQCLVGIKVCVSGTKAM